MRCLKKSHLLSAMVAQHSGNGQRKGTRMSRANISKRRFLTSTLGLTVVAGLMPLRALGQGAEGPSARIETLHGVLLDAMKQSGRLGVKGRFDKLAPVLLETY